MELAVLFLPIINPPGVAIHGVSRTKIENNGKLTLPLSLSYDHRVIDGAAGAAFVVLLSNVLSNAKNLSNHLAETEDTRDVVVVGAGPGGMLLRLSS